jgi:hypothetical protein
MIDDLRLRRDDVGGLYRREFKNQRFQMIADSPATPANWGLPNGRMSGHRVWIFWRQVSTAKCATGLPLIMSLQ